MSNYDDFDPLENGGCALDFVEDAVELKEPDLIILPGTKNTIDDLNFLRKTGLDRAILRLAGKGTPVIGVCGGFQMLGKVIHDPSKVESLEETSEGLGLLDIETTFQKTKTTTQVKARVAVSGGLLEGLAGIEVTGYEIHMGQSDNGESSMAFRVFETPEGAVDYSDGAVSRGGLIFGTYCHGLFHNVAFTRGLLDGVRRLRGLPAATAPAVSKNEQYDELAKIVRQNLDIKRIYEIMG